MLKEIWNSHRGNALKNCRNKWDREIAETLAALIPFCWKFSQILNNDLKSHPNYLQVIHRNLLMWRKLQGRIGSGSPQEVRRSASDLGDHLKPLWRGAQITGRFLNDVPVIRKLRIGRRNHAYRPRRDGSRWGGINLDIFTAGGIS